MQKTITFPTHTREALYDITDGVAGVVADSGIGTGLCAVYAQGATAAIMIQENWDESVRTMWSRFCGSLPRGRLGARPAGRQRRQPPEVRARRPERDHPGHRRAARPLEVAEHFLLRVRRPAAGALGGSDRDRGRARLRRPHSCPRAFLIRFCNQQLGFTRTTLMRAKLI